MIVEKLNNGFYQIEFTKPVEIAVFKTLDDETGEICFCAYIRDFPLLPECGSTEKEAIDNLTTSIFGDILFLMNEKDEHLTKLAREQKNFLQKHIKTYKELSKDGNGNV